MLTSWPQRRRFARLYHAFKPLSRAKPVVFEDVHTAAIALETDVAGACSAGCTVLIGVSYHGRSRYKQLHLALT